MTARSKSRVDRHWRSRKIRRTAILGERVIRSRKRGIRTVLIRAKELGGIPA